MGVEWLNRYVALEKEDNYGIEPGTVIKIAVVSGTQNDGWSNNATGTFTMTSAEGGTGCAGTVTTSGTAVASFTVTDGGQKFSHNDDIAFTMTGIGGGTLTDDCVTLYMGGQPGDDTTTANRSTGLTNGGNNTNGIIYGEADDESMKQTFELLGRSDMSRQVASKSVTNTQ